MGRYGFVSGETYGRLTTVREVERVVYGSGIAHRRVMCRCECGRDVIALLPGLRSGDTRSCGCLRREVTAARSVVDNATHGQSGTVAYKRWGSIKDRCLNEACKDYGNYGGRGIRMHDGWIEDFAAFKAYTDAALGPRPRGHSIDRIDNDGHYEPGNLRWATPSTQRRNQRAYIAKYGRESEAANA